MRQQSGVPIDVPALADCLCRLHRKFLVPQAFCDISWACEFAQQGTRLRWGARLYEKRPGSNARSRQFATYLERMALLTPTELQKLLCACVLLSRRENFRRCIDGARVRALQEMIGTGSMVALMSSKTAHRVPAGSSNWHTISLVSEGFAHIERACRGQHGALLDFIRIGLPRQLPVASSDHEEADFEKLMLEVHQWYPEFTWLFG